MEKDSTDVAKSSVMLPVEQSGKPSAKAVLTKVKTESQVSSKKSKVRL